MLSGAVTREQLPELVESLQDPDLNTQKLCSQAIAVTVHQRLIIRTSLPIQTFQLFSGVSRWQNCCGSRPRTSR